MKRVKLVVAYDGTNYCGWQIQPNGITIEEVLNKKLSKLTGEEIRVIGADSPILDTEVPVRQLLEQIIAKLGVPPFLLGLHWSTTERMSKQQADLLTSELERYRSLLTPVLRRILDTHLRLWGHTAPFAVEWQDISLQDTAELAQARYDNARAAVLEEQLTEKGEIV